MTLRAAAFVFLVACAPSTYDGLVSGDDKALFDGRSGTVKKDASLEAPRRLSPLSVMSVASLRPRFRWADADHVVLELSRARTFETARRFEGRGVELALPEDLEPGIWFWRLTRRGTDAAGNQVEGDPNVTAWELDVRAPAVDFAGTPHPSDVPMGSLVDLNGDGEPDLQFVAEEPELDEGGAIRPYQHVLLGQPNHTFALDGDSAHFAMSLFDVRAEVSGGVDLDGDGYSDVVVSDVPTAFGGTGLLYGHFGSKAGFDDAKSAFGIAAPNFAGIARLAASGDVNGDGYGDVAASAPGMAFASLGGPVTADTVLLLDAELPSANAATAGPVGPGADFDGDGLADVPLALALSAPLSVARGTRSRFESVASISVALEATLGKAVAIATGDFDGNGASDIAFTTSLGGKPAVCVYSPSAGSLSAEQCWVSEGPLEGFGEQLAAGDLDADGRDDLLVSTPAGIVALARTEAGFTSAVVSDGIALTVIAPGRPEPARWAAVARDRSSIMVYSGTKPAQKLDAKSLSGSPTIHRVR